MYVTHMPLLLKYVEFGFGSLWATPTFIVNVCLLLAHHKWYIQQLIQSGIQTVLYLLAKFQLVQKNFLEAFCSRVGAEYLVILQFRLVNSYETIQLLRYDKIPCRPRRPHNYRVDRPQATELSPPTFTWEPNQPGVAKRGGPYKSMIRSV